nr:hypothetical protein [Kibdelosporangium sp. MJ126-NF4]CTQ91972.1 hypothetical protein [Kibdelosporangium sp. MJ126-NF4]
MDPSFLGVSHVVVSPRFHGPAVGTSAVDAVWTRPVFDRSPRVPLSYPGATTEDRRRYCPVR